MKVETSTQLAPLKRATPPSLDWLALSNRPSGVCVYIPSPEDGNSSGFSYVVFSGYLEFQTICEVHKPRDSVILHRQIPLDSTYFLKFCKSMISYSDEEIIKWYLEKDAILLLMTEKWTVSHVYRN
jgi:hypothetical protein